MGLMVGSADARVEQMAREAEEKGLFIVAASRADLYAMERRVAKGLMVSPCRGLYMQAARHNELSPRERSLAAIRTLGTMHPHYVFCSYSAALLHGLQVSYALLDEVHVAARRNQWRGEHRGLVRFHLVEEDEPVSVQGLRVTSLLRTLLDCMCQAPFRYGLAIVDSALHWRLVSRAQLEAYVAVYGKGRIGISTARRVLRYCDGRAENGGESVARATIIDLGLMIPELQVEVTDPMNPNVSARVDMFWLLPDGRIIIGELDGFVKYRDGSAAGVDEAVRRLARERRREAHLNLTGATVVRFSYAEAEDPEYLFKLLTQAGVPLAGSGVRGRLRRHGEGA